MMDTLYPFARSLLEEAAKHGEEKEEGASAIASATSIWAIVTFLVVLSISFEKGKEHLDESVSKNMKPVLATVFAEMTLLGFIGLVFFFINKAGILQGWSDIFFHEEEALTEMFEMVHMILFLVMMIFLIKIVGTLKFASKLEKEWEEYEAQVMDIQGEKDKDAKGRKEQEYLAEPKFSRYYRLRKQFISPLEKAGSEEEKKEAKEEGEGEGKKANEEQEEGLSEDFDFAKYLALLLSDDLKELVEVPIGAWVGLWCAFAVYWAYDVLVGGDTFSLLIGLFAGSFGLGVTTIYLENKLHQILGGILLPEEFLQGPSSGGYMALDQKSDFAIDVQDLPPYMGPENAPKSKDDLVEYEKEEYPMANPTLIQKQFGLFWFRNPELLLKLLQATTLGQAVFAAVMGVLLAGESLNMDVRNRLFLALVQVACMAFGMSHAPEILQCSVMCLHLENFKSEEAIEEVVRDMRTKKVLSVLKMLGWMKSSIVSGGQDGQAAKEDTRTAADIWTSPSEFARKTKEVHELFDLFDEDKQGDIDLQEFGGLMKQMAGVEDPAEVERVFKTLDSSGDGSVDFDEFFNWYARRLADEATGGETLIRRIFDTVDIDGGGEISLDELVKTFQGLGEDVKESDLQWIFDEADEDGSGELDFEEFSDLLKKYVFN